METGRNFIRALFVLLLATIVHQASASGAQEGSASRILDGAKKEGALLWYTALNLNDSQMLTKRFEQLYPFIKTETLRLSFFALLSKI